MGYRDPTSVVQGRNDADPSVLGEFVLDVSICGTRTRPVLLQLPYQKVNALKD